MTEEAARAADTTKQNDQNDPSLVPSLPWTDPLTHTAAADLFCSRVLSASLNCPARNLPLLNYES
jgi:hypothetical protein